MLRLDVPGRAAERREAADTLGLEEAAGEGAIDGRVRATGRRPALAVGVGAATVVLGTVRTVAVVVGVLVAAAGVARCRRPAPPAGVVGELADVDRADDAADSEGLAVLGLTGDRVVTAEGLTGDAIRLTAVPAALEVAAEREATDDTLLILVPLVGRVGGAPLVGLSLDAGVEDAEGVCAALTTGRGAGG